MPGTVSPPPGVNDPDMHHCTCVTHVPWCMPESLTSGFLWSRWRGKRSRHSRRMHNPQLYVSGKRPIADRILPCATLCSQYYCCWQLGDAMRQVISSRLSVDIVIIKESSFVIASVKCEIQQCVSVPFHRPLLNISLTTKIYFLIETAKVKYRYIQLCVATGKLRSKYCHSSLVIWPYNLISPITKF